MIRLQTKKGRPLTPRKNAGVNSRRGLGVFFYPEKTAVMGRRARRGSGRTLQMNESNRSCVQNRELFTLVKESTAAEHG